MNNEYMIFGTIIPSAEYLYDCGLADIVCKFYYLDYDKYQEKYPILRKYNREMIPIYALYLQITNSCVYNRECKYEDVVNELNNSNDMRQSVDFMLRSLSDLLVDFEVDGKNIEENYNRYIHQQLNVYNNNPKVIKFMKKCNAKPVETAVRSYLLSNAIKLENVGIELSHDEEVEKVIYIIFDYIYKQYIETCKNNLILKHLFKKNLNFADQEVFDKYITLLLDHLNTYLFTFDEYKDYIRNRKIYGCSVLDIVDSQYMLDCVSARVRIDEE